MLLGDGDGFVRCACGHWHWGTHGAAGLLVFDPARGVLLQRRAWWTHHGHTWAVPGGAVRSDETPRQGAIREAVEEAQLPPESLRVLAQSTEEHHTWRYTTVLATTRAAVTAHDDSGESAELRWVPPERVERFPLHRDFAAAWPTLAGQLDRELVLIVEGASVSPEPLNALAASPLPATALEIGHGPDDARLWSWWPRLLRTAGPDESLASARQAHRERPGDHVVVVTADGELRGRAAAEGVATIAPATLLSLVDRPDDHAG